MTTDEIIKKLGIEPFSFRDDIGKGYPLYTHSDLDRIVAEVAAGYEAKIQRWVNAKKAAQKCSDMILSSGTTEKAAILMRELAEAEKALSQSSPLAALEEVRKAAKIEALEVAAELAYNAGAGDVEEDLRRMANELKDE